MNPKRLANDKAWGGSNLTQERQGTARDLDDKERVLFRTTSDNLVEDGSGGQPRRGASSKWPHVERRDPVKSHERGLQGEALSIPGAKELAIKFFEMRPER